MVGKALAFQLSFDLDIGLTVNLMAYQQAGQIGGFDGTALFAQDTHRSQPIDGRVSIPTWFADAGIIEVPGDDASVQSGGGKAAPAPLGVRAPALDPIKP